MKKSVVFFLVVMTLFPVLAFADDPAPRGLIFVSSRNLGFANPGGEGPTVGDVSMLVLLQNAGYRGKVVPDITCDEDVAAAQLSGDTPELVVLSGSSSSSDVKAMPTGVPVMMGEHVTLQNASKPGYMPFYEANSDSDDSNVWPDDATKTMYMKIVNTTHPITQGIVTDANGLVKIMRDPYPDEDAYSKGPTGAWKKNYEFGWPEEPVASKASGLTILGVCPFEETMSVFAVFDKGDTMVNGSAATARFVHMFINENGSGGVRRRFNSLNETGRLLFVRAAQWAMGDPLSDWGAAEVENWDLY